MFVYTIQPVVKPVVSCKRGLTRTNVSRDLDEVGADVEDGRVARSGRGRGDRAQRRRPSAVADPPRAHGLVDGDDAASRPARLRRASGAVARRVGARRLARPSPPLVVRVVPVGLQRRPAEVARDAEMQPRPGRRRLPLRHRRAAVDRVPGATERHVGHHRVLVVDARLGQRRQDRTAGARAPGATVTVYRDRQVALHRAPTDARRSSYRRAVCDR